MWPAHTTHSESEVSRTEKYRAGPATAHRAGAIARLLLLAQQVHQGILHLAVRLLKRCRLIGEAIILILNWAQDTAIQRYARSKQWRNQDSQASRGRTS